MDFKQCILLGLPGIGVKDHGIALAERWNVPYVSMGDLVREAIASSTDLGMEARPYVEAGEPVPDALVMKLLRRRLQQPDAMLNGWVLEGMPRTSAQADVLAAWMAKVGLPTPTVVYLKAMMGLLLNKLWTKGQQESSQQGTPQIAPTRHQIRHHLNQSQEALDPLIDYYQERSQLTVINGSLSFAEVAGDLFKLAYQDTGTAPLIRDEDELNKLLAGESLLVVDCLASWCGSCKLVAPMIDQLAEAYRDRVKVMKIDFDANKQIPERFGLKGMPAVMFFKDGQLQETLTGVKPYQDYSSVITRFL